jgi:hypothetical protein
MITIANKGRAVKLIEDDNNQLAINGRQLIQINKDVVVPARSSIEFDMKLQITLTDMVDACVIGEYILDEDTPLFIVGETYHYGCYKPNSVIVIYNSSDEDYTIKKGYIIAHIAQYHLCTCQIEGHEHYWTGITGQQIVYEKDDLKVYADANKDYPIEIVTENNGTSYIKIPLDKE